jgi:predicted secreted protein
MSFLHVTDQALTSKTVSALDALTQGAFSAPTSGERSAKLREWLASHPQAEVIQEVYKEMSAKDKGAAKPLREKLDELKRLKAQESLAQEWVIKAQALLAAPKFHVADALAWQRDAAKAGAPLSREPLSEFKVLLSDGVKRVEDLEHRAQVQREAAVMMSQRIEILSTKSWKEGLSLQESLAQDVDAWMAEQARITAHAQWGSVDTKYPNALANSGQQLHAVWEAFSAALTQVQKAFDSAQEALPAVPAWAEEIKNHRSSASPAPQQMPKQKVDPEQKAHHTERTQAAIKALETELAQGHGKASAEAAMELRNALKEGSRMIDEKLDHKAQAVLAAASELEGWQRWRADQLRAELLAKAEALFKRVPIKTDAREQVVKVTRAEGKKHLAPETALAPTAATSVDSVQASPVLTPGTDLPGLGAQASGSAVEPVATHATDATDATDAIHTTLSHEDLPAQTPPSSDVSAHTLSPLAAQAPTTSPVQEIIAPKAPEYNWVPVVGGRKMQEALRDLREQWKLTDQGGLPNHALWKRFDQACNRAFKVVEAWQEKVRQESAAHQAQRKALIQELQAWTLEHAQGPEWKNIARQLHHFSERWRDCGHVSEKAFVELQAQWKAAMQAAHAPLEAVQAQSIERRQALIASAQALGAEDFLRIDAVKSLQQRWQVESQSVVLDRKQEQKLWDAFRQPIDQAFERKTQQREQAHSAMSAFDAAVIKASKALDEATQSEDAQAIRQAMTALQSVLHGEVTETPHAAPPAAVASSASPAPAPAADPLPSSEATPTAAPMAAGALAGSESTPEGVALKDEAAAPPPEALSAELPPLTPSEGESATEVATTQAPSAPVLAKAPAKPVIAVRGDDRPGQKKTEPQNGKAVFGKGAKPGFNTGKPGASGAPDSRGGPRGDTRSDARGDTRAHARGDSRDGKMGARGERGFGAGEGAFAPRGPRLGDAAYRAQRQALEAAQSTMKKLSVMAHGEALSQLMAAWQSREPQKVPALKDLSPRLTAPQRQEMIQALAAVDATPKAQTLATESLLRLEIASGVPTPAHHLSERRALQLQLLTRRNDPLPEQTWVQDLSKLFKSEFDADKSTRLQNTLKVLLKNQ